jgi:hypothetical protein
MTKTENEENNEVFSPLIKNNKKTHSAKKENIRVPKKKKIKKKNKKTNFKKITKKNKKKDKRKNKTKKIGTGDFLDNKKKRKDNGEGGGPISRKLSNYAAKPLKWLRGRTNIFSFDAFENDLNDYLISLFIYFRYRQNVKKRQVFLSLSKMIATLSRPSLSKLSSNKNPLIQNIIKLHDLINEITMFNSLTISNKVCLKNCICLGIVETLRFMSNLNRKGLEEFYDRVFYVLNNLKDNLFFNNDTEFESRFRVKYETYQHLNFRIFNSYDNGLVFNILSFGIFYHNRRFLYAEKARKLIAGSNKSIDNNKNIFLNKEVELQKEQYKIRELLFTHYNQTTKNGKHILPNPNKKMDFIGKNGARQQEYIKKISEYLRTKQQDTQENYKENNKELKDIKDPAEISGEANQIFDSYVTLMKSMTDLGKVQSENPETIFDELENKFILSKNQKHYMKKVITMYFNDTTGLFKGNISSSENHILENVSDFPTIFVNQIESASLELDYINFKVA